LCLDLLQYGRQPLVVDDRAGRHCLDLVNTLKPNVALLTPEVLLRVGLSPAVKVLDLKGRLRCRGCGRKGRAVVSIKWRGRRASGVARDNHAARKGSMPSRSEPAMKKTATSSKTIRANKRKASLKAKRRRQRARAGYRASRN
jgi:hypothetical protein